MLAEEAWLSQGNPAVSSTARHYITSDVVLSYVKAVFFFRRLFVRNRFRFRLDNLNVNTIENGNAKRCPFNMNSTGRRCRLNSLNRKRGREF